MRLTPLDIRKQEFGRGFRGFAEDEVTSFLQMLSNQWEEMLTEQRGLEQKARDAEVKLEHYV
ncbi:MAG TPA: DivIVA domain-containing protein, partial [Rhodothermales bacterium]|nr:DivIVA domain-containing protein [Rhodothermales bacterium]